jgi:hypothetical protein
MNTGRDLAGMFPVVPRAGAYGTHPLLQDIVSIPNFSREIPDFSLNPKP